MRRGYLPLCLLAACAALACAKAGPPAQSGGKGTIQFGASTRITTAPGATSSLNLCAHVSLRPYAPDANGHVVFTDPGQPPITFIAGGTSAAAQSGPIEGCIAGDSYGLGYNWGYQGTATDFFDCNDADAGTLANVYPHTVFLDVELVCIPDHDINAQFDIPVSVTVPDSVGYVDLSAQVDTSLVYIGCKQADLGQQDGQLHFAEIGAFNPLAASTPAGFTAIGYIDAQSGNALPAAPGAVEQAAGVSQLPPSANSGAYFTGHLDQTQLPTGSTRGSWEVVQTFAQQCAAGSVYAATGSLACDTRISQTGEISTLAMLSSALLLVPNALWLFADIESDPSTLLIRSGGTTTLSDATVSPATTAWNAETESAAVSFGAGATIVAVNLDLHNPGTLLVAIETSAGLLVSTVAQDQSGKWSAQNPTPISALSAAQQAALLSPITPGCVPISQAHISRQPTDSPPPRASAHDAAVRRRDE